MSLAARSPRSRKSLSLQDSNKDNVVLPFDSGIGGKGKGKKGARMSFAGEGMSGGAFTLGQAGVPKEASSSAPSMSPCKMARRSMQPRKSILKGLPATSSPKMQRSTSFPPEFTEERHAHTIAFSLPIITGDEPSLKASTARRQSRVSFAAHAHVRMFDSAPSSSKSSGSNAFAPVPLPPRAIGQAHTFTGASSRPSHAHSRRASIQSIPAVPTAGVTKPPISVNEEADGSMDMEIETESEASDDLSTGSEGDEVPATINLPKRFSGVSGVFSLGAVTAMANEEENEDDLDMDETQIIHGGIVSRPQGGDSSDDEDENDDITRDSNLSLDEDDKTMDFTVAMGGLIPALPPAGAVNNRRSIGYTVPMDRAMAPFEPANASDDSEMEIEMDETIALGGIVMGDESMSMSSGGEDTRNEDERTMTFAFGSTFGQPEDDGGMEFTIAAGGILGEPVPEGNADEQASTPHKTPSFARPTASSQLKEKRNIFGPSPSPNNSTTPRGTPGLEAAKDVAKRLSFGSITGSGGPKRPRDDAQETPSKKTRAEEQVFGGPSIPKSPFKSPFKSPRRQSLAMRSPAKDPEWAQPAISLAAFLEMAGVGFMEGLPGVGRRRRSSVGRGVLGGEESQGGVRDYPVQAYTEAQVMSVFHHMYTWASSKMKEDITQGLAEIAETEAMFSQENPPGIQDYLSAQDEERVHFEQLFKEYKTNTHLNAKTRWYDWKQSVVARIKPDVEELLVGMREDDAKLTALAEQADSLLPDLKARLAALQEELGSERAIVAEIEACDQSELADYKEAIAEQGTQITSFNIELAEATAKLDALNLKLTELNGKKQESITAISIAKSKCDQFTKSDVGKLREEYASLQHMHLWRPTKMLSDVFQLEFDHEIRLTFQCKDSVPDVASATVELLPESYGIKHGKPRRQVAKVASSTEGLFKVFQAAVIQDVEGSTVTTLVRRAGQLWCAAQRLRAELRLVTLRYPVTYRSSEGGESMTAAISVLIPSLKSKAEFNFVASADILRGWPSSLANAEIAARTVYGSADATLLVQAAKEMIAQSADEGYLAGLLLSMDAAQL